MHSVSPVIQKNPIKRMTIKQDNLSSAIIYEGNPSETDSIKYQISTKTSRGKGTGKKKKKKNAIKDITNDSQVNSYFPYSWSPASLTINIYFYLFSYLYITRTTINNVTPHLKSLKSQNRRVALGRPAIKLLGASTYLRSTNPRP